MVYANYEYYKETYLGAAISEADFPRYALRASSFLDYYTQGRAEKNPSLEALKMACCNLAEQYQIIDTAQMLAQKSLACSLDSEGAEKQSETVGRWSKSYRSGGDSAASATVSAENAKQALADTARRYLTGTGLLYRGRRCCSCPCFHTL